jgi:hypothetical protein
MTDVIVGGEDSDSAIFATAIACVRYRLNQGVYDFDPYVEGRAELAAEIVYSQDEDRAWRFLKDNSGFEYEEVMRVTVIE